MNARQAILEELTKGSLTKIALYNRLKKQGRWIPLRDLESVLDELYVAEQLISYDPRTKAYSITHAGQAQVRTGQKS
jgi:hypothetical protein